MAIAVPAVAEVPIVAHFATGSMRQLIVADKGADTIVFVGSTLGIRTDEVVTRLSGLEKLPELRRLSFILFPQIHDFSFITELSGLRGLFIGLGSLSGLRVIEQLPSLRHFSLETVRSPENTGVFVPEAPIDLARLRFLETVMLDDCALTRFPRFVNVPTSLRYVDLESNGLVLDESDARWLAELAGVEYIFVWGNEVQSELFERFPNLTVELSQDIVPDYWRE